MQIMKDDIEHLDFMADQIQQAITYYEYTIRKENYLLMITLIQRLHKINTISLPTPNEERYNIFKKKLYDLLLLEKEYAGRSEEGDTLLKNTIKNCRYKFNKYKNRLEEK